MNAERLHAIVRALDKELSSLGTVQKLEALHNSLQTLVQQSHPSHQQLFANSRNAFMGALAHSASDDFSPAWRQLLNEMGGAKYFGKPLKAIVEAIIDQNQMTPAVALEEIGKLLKSLQEYDSAIDQLIGAFKKFNISDERLEPGACEIGMLIPRAEVDNNLRQFTEELDELAFVLDTFAEVATGKPDHLSIKAISSSDLTVYLEAAPAFAACVAVAVERVVALYKQVLEIKKLRGELLNQAVPEKQLAPIEQHANGLMEKGIDEFAGELVQQFYKEKDAHRKNELANAVRVSMRRIANRIDRGYNIEVRVEPMKKDAQPEEGANDLAKNIQAIQTASPKSLSENAYRHAGAHARRRS
jgi:hypothetical protein